MRSNYFLLILISIFSISSNAQTQIGQTLTNFELGDGLGASLSMSANGSRLLTSAPRFDTDGVFISGRVDVYEFDGSSWVPLGQTLDGGTPVEFGQYGRGLEMSDSGNRIAIGNSDSESQVYEWNGGTQQWEQMGTALEFDGDPDTQLRRFRFSSDENTLVIGGSNSGDDSVYVFQWDGSNWNTIGNPLQDPATNRIAISNDAQTIANSYNNFGSDNGINIYTFDGTDWILDFARSFVSPVEISDGFDLSGSGNRLVLSYWDEIAETGTFETYDRVGGNWEASVSTFSLPFDSNNNALRLSNNGTVFIYGSGTENAGGTDAGGTRVYQKSGNNWVLVNYFDYPNYDESILGNVFISGNGTKVALGQSIPFDVGFVQVYDISDILSVETGSTETFKLYPNPTTGRLTIDLPISEEIQKITILDVTGRIVQRMDYDSANQNSIELEGPVGMYLIVIATNNSQKTFKVLKQ